MKTQILKDKTLYVKTPEFIASPEIHSSFKSEYELTDFKLNQIVNVELVSNKVKVYNDNITEYWNVTETFQQSKSDKVDTKESIVLKNTKTVSDQITDSVTSKKGEQNEMDKT